MKAYLCYIKYFESFTAKTLTLLLHDYLGLPEKTIKYLGLAEKAIKRQV